MDLSPQAVSAATFKFVKKGFDPDEVRSYLDRVSATLEASQQQATAMEARARAAIAKMQDLSQQAAAVPAEPKAPVAPDEAETISRTLLLAQRTADTTVAEAKAEAESVTSSAHAAAETLLAEARAEADRVLGEARGDARRVKDEELSKADGEVQALLARRDFLLADVDHLEQYVQAQRERIRDAAAALEEIADRVPSGLAEMRRPLLSASDETGELILPHAHGSAEEGTDDPPPEAPSGEEQGQNDRTPVADELLFRPTT